MTELQKLMKQTGETDQELSQLCLDDAKAFVLNYTNRKTLPVALYKTVRDLAVISLNRIGTEGESARTGAGESYTFDDAPRRIFDVLNGYRLARVGGKVYEAET